MVSLDPLYVHDPMPMPVQQDQARRDGDIEYKLLWEASIQPRFHWMYTIFNGFISNFIFFLPLDIQVLYSDQLQTCVNQLFNLDC